MAKKRTKAELTAYAAFLFSELGRHQQDCIMIECKLKILAARGIVATKEGDWIDQEDLMKCKIVVDESDSA